MNIDKSKFTARLIILLVISVLCAETVTAQWRTQSFKLKPGWNAVYLHVDASHAVIGDLDGLNEDITDIWLWKPKLKADQFIEDPDIPTDGKSRWIRWNKDLGPSSALQRLIGNSSYLIKYGIKAEDGTWTPSNDGQWDIKGQPLPPSYNWTSTGLNFIGLADNLDTGKSFEQFFPAQVLNDAEFHTYKGGELSNEDGSRNPDKVHALRTTPVQRGEAFWMRVGDSFNSYFGPFDLVLQESDGAHFGESKQQYRILIRNRVEESLSVTMTLKDTEDPPEGQPALKNGLQVLVKGEANPTDLSYGYKRLENGGASVWTLSPSKSGTVGADSSQEIIIGIDRHNMEGQPGDVFGGILEFKDSLGLVKYEVPITSIIPSNSGLWVGDVQVWAVRHDITFFRKKNEEDVETDENGEAASDGINDTYGPVPENYPLRFIFHRHNSDSAQTKLFQRVYYGLRKGAELANDFVVTNDERALDRSSLGAARRIAAAHLPWTKENNGWNCEGDISMGSNMTAKVNLSYNDRISNPFIHAYHPDHDNLDAKFKNELNQGNESWGINREMTFGFDEPNDDFLSLVRVGSIIRGEFHEMVQLTGAGTEKKEYHAKGFFQLNRINESNDVFAYDGIEPESTSGAPNTPDEAEGEPEPVEGEPDEGDGG